MKQEKILRFLLYSQKESRDEERPILGEKKKLKRATREKVHPEKTFQEKIHRTEKSLSS